MVDFYLERSAHGRSKDLRLGAIARPTRLLRKAAICCSVAMATANDDVRKHAELRPGSNLVMLLHGTTTRSSDHSALIS